MHVPTNVKIVVVKEKNQGHVQNIIRNARILEFDARIGCEKSAKLLFVRRRGSA